MHPQIPTTTSLFCLLSAVQQHLRPMALIASLPRNDPELARAALEHGADAVKVHVGLHHHASDTHFGTLDQERPAIEQVFGIWKGRPCGLVPGSGPDIDRKTLDALPGLGARFLSLYLRHAVPGTLPTSNLVERMLALSWEDDLGISQDLQRLDIQALELSIMHPDTYGEPFTYHDLARCAAVRRQVDLPLVVPTQHRITLQSVRSLARAGIQAIMIGSVVAGSTPQSWAEATRRFRQAVDRVF